MKGWLEVGLLAMFCFFNRDMSSAILLARVESHFALIPSLESIKSAQKNLPSSLPISEFMHACDIHLTPLLLSHLARKTGHGSSVKSSVSMTVSAAQYSSITEMNSNTLMLTKFPSLSFLRNFFVLYRMSVGQVKNQMNLISMEKPPPASRQASEHPSAVGSLGIRCPIGVAHLMPEFGCNASRKNSISRRIVFGIKYSLSHRWSCCAAFLIEKLMTAMSSLV